MTLVDPQSLLTPEAIEAGANAAHDIDREVFQKNGGRTEIQSWEECQSEYRSFKTMQARAIIEAAIAKVKEQMG